MMKGREEFLNILIVVVIIQFYLVYYFVFLKYVEFILEIYLECI